MTRIEKDPGDYAYVVGIDASLTSTGLARLELRQPDALATDTIRSTGRRADTVAERHDRLRKIMWRVRDLVPRFSLVVIEGPSYGSRGGSAWDRAGLWHYLVGAVLANDCAIAVVAPQTRAKWATGKGNADKAAVAAVVARLCPDADLDGSDATDALTLALMGAHALGWRPDLDTAYRAESLLKPEWPPKIAARLLRPYETPAKETPDATP